MRIGDHALNTTGEGNLKELTVNIVKYTNHESYNNKTSDYDITIIELAQEVDINTYTPACLAKTSDTTTFDGKKAWIYGDKLLIVEYARNSNYPRLGSFIQQDRGLCKCLTGAGGFSGDQGDLHHRLG